MKKEKIIVNEEFVGKRIDSVVSCINLNISRSMVQKLIEEGKIIVNGKTIKSSYKVLLNDEIEINIPEAKQIDLKAEDIKLDVIYEDNDIIVINKPKGMVVHPAVRKF